MKCNGCGTDIGELENVPLAATFSYGSITEPDRMDPRARQDAVEADHHKTLCPRCQHVLKDILLSSNLSEHWHKYEWELMDNDAYTEGYDESE